VDDFYVYEYETMLIDNVCECVFDMWILLLCML
jgi:hypothetical protein